MRDSSAPPQHTYIVHCVPCGVRFRCAVPLPVASVGLGAVWPVDCRVACVRTPDCGVSSELTLSLTALRACSMLGLNSRRGPGREASRAARCTRAPRVGGPRGSGGARAIKITKMNNAQDEIENETRLSSESPREKFFSPPGTVDRS